MNTLAGPSMRHNKFLRNLADKSRSLLAAVQLAPYRHPLHLTTIIMPRSPSPPRGPRRRSPSPRRDRDRDSGRDRDYDRRPRSRSRSPPPKATGPKRAKELSFYKKGSGSGSLGSFSSRRDPLDEPAEETAKERMQRRERGEVPARFGGTRQQGVRNTMSQVAPTGTAPTGMGSLKRTYDPLDRMPVKGADADAREREREVGYDRDRDRSYARRDEPSGRRDGDRAREERMKAMDKPQAVPTAAP